MFGVFSPLLNSLKHILVKFDSILQVLFFNRSHNFSHLHTFHHIPKRAHRYTFDYNPFSTYLSSTNYMSDIVAGSGDNDDFYLGSERIQQL